MASKFRILTHRNSESLHLKLMGDFDGSSAWQLLNQLKEISPSVDKVIIHTNCLDNIYPFGRDTFLQNLNHLKGRSVRLLLTGENAERIASENSYEFKFSSGTAKNFDHG